MAAFLTMTVLLGIYLVVLVGIPVLIGIYVYRDAKSRGMNAPLWTLIAVLAPVFVGLIIYLLVRGSYSDLKCPNCAAPVTEQFRSCPRCGARLKPACPSCAAPVEPDWKVCPHCGNPLPEFGADFTPPVRRQDKTLWKILLIAVLIPVLLIVSIFLLLSISTTSYSARGSSVAAMPVGEYLSLTENPQIEQWLDSCGEDEDTAYVLRYTEPWGDETQVQYMVYLHSMADQPGVNGRVGDGPFGGPLLRLDLPRDGSDAGQFLVLATCSGDPIPKLEVSSDGKKLDCEVTDVSEPLTLADTLQGVLAQEG